MLYRMVFHVRSLTSACRQLSKKYDFAAKCRVKLIHNVSSRPIGPCRRTINAENCLFQKSAQKRRCFLLLETHLRVSHPATRCLSNSFVCYNKENQVNEEESKKENENVAENAGKPLSQRQKLARTFAAYGTTGVVFHTCISLASLGTCYMIVSSGVDMVSILEKIGVASKAGLQSTLASGASTFVIAYACHKVFMPVRIFLTVTCTPIIVNKLKSLGVLKEKSKMKNST